MPPTGAMTGPPWRGTGGWPSCQDPVRGVPCVQVASGVSPARGPRIAAPHRPAGAAVRERSVRRSGRDTGGNRLDARPGGGGPALPAPPRWMRWLPVLYVAAVLVIEPVTPVEWPVSFLLVALPL